MDASAELGSEVVPPVFGSAGPVTKAIDLDEIFSDYYFSFGSQDGEADESAISAAATALSDPSAPLLSLPDICVEGRSWLEGQDSGRSGGISTMELDTESSALPGAAVVRPGEEDMRSGDGIDSTGAVAAPGAETGMKMGVSSKGIGPMPVGSEGETETGPGAGIATGTMGAVRGGGLGSRGIGISLGLAAGVAYGKDVVKQEGGEGEVGGVLGKRHALAAAPEGTGHVMGGADGVGSGGLVVGMVNARSMSEKQKLERRERNREHAKRSRIRKKFMLECLQEQLLSMRKQNMALRQVVKEHMPEVATTVFEKCINEKALVLSGKDSGSAAPLPPLGEQGTKEPNCLLLEPDFQLIQALMESQQNFTVSDPSMADNPIVYASQGFLDLTGYTIQDVVGRNCRFLQGPGTDPRAIDIIRRGVEEGRDTSVCLLNYKADETPFWNQFFIAALRDEHGKIVNFVGVQCEVKAETAQEFRDRLRKIPLPEELMRDNNGDKDGDEVDG